MLPEKSGASMSVLREIAVAIVGVYALLFACDAAFGVGRFDDDYYRASFYAPQQDTFRFASDMTPAARISDAFSVFTPGEVKSGRRYSSLTTIIR